MYHLSGQTYEPWWVDNIHPSFQRHRRVQAEGMNYFVILLEKDRIFNHCRILYSNSQGRRHF
ncbi:hypothetical protein C4J81_12245 [Deltaproteobacteria bacterium Smac51]|nr:hypothetical protein C4J81_12245 [Deltaproteobacteria bacterium Smac51]